MFKQFLCYCLVLDCKTVERMFVKTMLQLSSVDYLKWLLEIYEVPRNVLGFELLNSMLRLAPVCKV